MVSKTEVERRRLFWHGFIKGSVWSVVTIAAILALMMIFLS